MHTCNTCPGLHAWAARAALAVGLLASAPAGATPPAVNLRVELRWVDRALPAAAQAGVRDAAVVVGTAGSVSPRGARVTSTAVAPPAAMQQLSVLNGQRASIQLAHSEALQWLDTTVELDPSAPPASTVRRIYASPRQGERRVNQGFSLTPRWPGGRAPVQVELNAQQEGAAVHTTLQLPLDRWQAVARLGGGPVPVVPGAAGTLDSRDATGMPERELQLRVSLQP